MNKAQVMPMHNRRTHAAGAAGITTGSGAGGSFPGSSSVDQSRRI